MYYVDFGPFHPATAELAAISTVREILKERVVVVQGHGNYAETSGEYREFSHEGYRKNIIRLLDAEGKIAAEAVLAEQKRQREMKYEVDRLVHQCCEVNLEAFLAHVKAFVYPT